MSNQYYYLLEGIEHGPFSRAAIERVLTPAQLQDAFLRTDADATWRTSDEIGMSCGADTARLNSQATPLPQSEPVAIGASPSVLQKDTEVQPKSENNHVIGVLLTNLFLLAAIGGIWLYMTNRDPTRPESTPAASVTHSQYNTQIAAADAATPPTTNNTQIEVAAPQLQYDSQSAAGIAEAAAQAADAGVPPVRPQAAAIRQATAETAPDENAPSDYARCEHVRDMLMGPEPTSGGQCGLAYQQYGTQLINHCKWFRQYLAAMGAHPGAQVPADQWELYTKSENEIADAYLNRRCQ